MKTARTRIEMERLLEGDNTRLAKDAIKAMKTAQSKVELMDRDATKMSGPGIAGILSDMIKVRNSLEMALKAKIA
jgi:hypothetical protein